MAFRTRPSLSSDRSTRDAPSEGDVLEAVAIVHGEGLWYLQWANGKYSVLMDPNQTETPMFERVGDLTKMAHTEAAVSAPVENNPSCAVDTKVAAAESFSEETTIGVESKTPRNTTERRTTGRRGGLCGSLPSSVHNRQLPDALFIAHYLHLILIA